LSARGSNAPGVDDVSSMRVVLLAGGKGTRLRPYTTVFPKPLVPVGDVPILEILLRKLAREGFTSITLSVGHLHSLIEAYVEARRAEDGLEITYVHESQPTGTAGALSLVDDLDGTFLLMNGDVLTTMPFPKLIDHHRKAGAALTIATHPKPVNVDLGVLESDDEGRIVSYTEKPTLHYQVSMGVYVMEPSVLTHIPRGAYFDFPDLVQALLADGQKVVEYRCEDYWLDIGRPEDYEKAQEDMARLKEAFGL
jgi:NDP-sugar pyrophosphorylase family protein